MHGFFDGSGGGHANQLPAPFGHAEWRQANFPGSGRLSGLVDAAPGVAVVSCSPGRLVLMSKLSSAALRALESICRVNGQRPVIGIW